MQGGKPPNRIAPGTTLPMLAPVPDVVPEAVDAPMGAGVDAARDLDAIAALPTSDRTSRTQFARACAGIHELREDELGYLNACAQIINMLDENSSLLADLAKRIMDGFEFTEAEDGVLLTLIKQTGNACATHRPLEALLAATQKHEYMEAYLVQPVGSELRHELIKSLIARDEWRDNLTWVEHADPDVPVDQAMIDLFFRFSRINNTKTRRSLLRAFLSSHPRGANVLRSHIGANDGFSVEDPGILGSYVDQHGHVVKLVDIIDDMFVFAHRDRSVELMRMVEGQLVAYAEDFVSDRVMQRGRIVYMRIPVPGHPNLHICYDPRDVDPKQKDPYNFKYATGDMEQYRLFISEESGVRELDPSELKIEKSEPHAPEYIWAGRGSGWRSCIRLTQLSDDYQLDVEKYVPADFMVNGAVRCYQYQIEFETRAGTSCFMKVLVPYSSDSRVKELRTLSMERKTRVGQEANDEEPAIFSPKQFVDAIYSLPLQAVVQPEGDYNDVKLLPFVHQDPSAIAFASGAFYLDWWSDERIIEDVIIHERMGHNTHFGGENILFPLMILAMKRTGWHKKGVGLNRAHAKLNLQEQWSEAHVWYFREVCMERPTFYVPREIGFVLGSVYTPDGSRFDPAKLTSIEDLGITLSVG